MPTPQPSRQHNKQITLIMKNNHLKIAVNKEPKLPQGGEKIIPCKLKMLGIGAGLAVGTLFGACQKENDTTQIQQHDTDYTFNIHTIISLKDITQIKASADSAEVRKIYFVPYGTWEQFSSNGISNLRKNVFEPALAAAGSKGSGKGNFEDINITPTDSLWMVQQGWTVNQR
jgi:hypothetical protein